MEIRDVLTNIKKYDAWDYKNYPLRKEEADAIIENYKEPCEDAVSRAEVMKLSQHKPEYGDMIYAFDVSILPSVKPVACIGKVEFDEEMLKDIVHETIENYSRPKGEWIGNEIGRCSVCGHKGCGSDIFNGCKDGMYCPNCGADVRGKE